MDYCTGLVGCPHGLTVIFVQLFPHNEGRTDDCQALFMSEPKLEVLDLSPDILFEFFILSFLFWILRSFLFFFTIFSSIVNNFSNFLFYYLSKLCKCFLFFKFCLCYVSFWGVVSILFKFLFYLLYTCQRKLGMYEISPAKREGSLAPGNSNV